MAIAAAAITAVESQPMALSTGPDPEAAHLPLWPATYIIAAIIGTAITPFSTALQ